MTRPIGTILTNLREDLQSKPFANELKVAATALRIAGIYQAVKAASIILSGSVVFGLFTLLIGHDLAVIGDNLRNKATPEDGFWGAAKKALRGGVQALNPNIGVEVFNDTILAQVIHGIYEGQQKQP